MVKKYTQKHAHRMYELLESIQFAIENLNLSANDVLRDASIRKELRECVAERRAQNGTGSAERD